MSTDDADQLLAQADEFRDREDYRAAYDLYLAASLIKEPTQRTIGLLQIMLEREVRQVLYTLLTKYSGSRVVRREVAAYLMKGPHAAFGVQLCDELFAKVKPSLEEELEIRWIRFEAAAHTKCDPGGQLCTRMAEDFEVLWNASTVAAQAPRRWSRRQILRTLAGIQDPSAIAALASLSALETVGPEVRELATMKVAELKTLNAAMDLCQ